MKRIASVFLALFMVVSLCPVTALAEETSVEYEGTSHYVAEDDLGVTNDELFAAYAQREFDEALGYEAPSFWSTRALHEGTLEKEIYDKLKVELAKVADGTTTSAEITINPTKSWSLADLDVTSFVSGGSFTAETKAAIEERLNLVYTCLLADCPLELYWHDKTIGIALGYSGSVNGNELSPGITYKFYVATDYSANGAAGTFVTNAAKTGATSTAIANAKAIVTANASKSDVEKLAAYKEKICELVSYDTAAATSMNTADGIDPWQMISVFDGNSGTNVVCEGYAKAFQYLCDLSTFSGDIECHTVNGVMSGGTGAGGHMWNVVTMDDGKNYLVDVTNCDTGTIGAPDKLFLAHTTNSQNANQTHTFTIGSQNIIFTYDASMADLFCDGYLALSTTAYKVATHVHTYDDNVDGTCNGCGVNRADVETRKVVHMLRLYNPYTGEHFYTGSTEERDNLVAVGWQYEGVGFTFPANTGAPVYRLYDPSTGEHLYTMDEAEKATLMGAGWNYEGIAFNSAYDTEAVQHRLHNPYETVGAYHFTFSEEEMQNLIKAGWEYQGIGWYSCWK